MTTLKMSVKLGLNNFRTMKKESFKKLVKTKVKEAETDDVEKER